MQPMLTANETCEVLNITYRTFERLVKEDRTFPAYKIGKKIWRVNPNKLEAWMEKQKEEYLEAVNPGPVIIKKRLGRPPLSGTSPR